MHALTYSKSPQFSEELVLDIFLKVWHNRAQLPDILHFKNYLFILSKNQIISAIRKQLTELKNTDALSDLTETALLPNKQLEAKESAAMLHQAIEQLSGQQKIAFTLSRFEKKTYEEIGAIMGITKRTVNFHIVAALNALREILYRHPLLVIWLLSC